MSESEARNFDEVAKHFSVPREQVSEWRKRGCRELKVCPYNLATIREWLAANGLQVKSSETVVEDGKGTKNGQNDNQLTELEIEQYRLKNRKLDEEIKDLKRSVFLKPNTWSTSVIALAALGGLILQYAFLSTNLTQARTERDLAKLEKLKIEQEKSVIEAEMLQVEQDKTELEQEVTGLTQQLTNTTTELVDADQQLAATKTDLEASRAQLSMTTMELSVTRMKRDEAATSLAKVETQLAATRAELTRVVNTFARVVETGNVVASGEEATITGTVVDLDGVPIREARVEVFRTETGQLLDQVLTNAAGEFQLSFPSGSPVDVIMRREGIQTDRFQRLAGNANHSLRFVPFAGVGRDY